MKTLLAFYYGSHPDDRGRFLAEILQQDDLWLEVTHDYIQWLFPLSERSRVTPWAPLVDPAIASAFQGDTLLQAHLLASFGRMLSFYGLRREAGRVVKGENWAERKPNWFIHVTHNNLRITRILKSLSALGLKHEAKAFLACLTKLRESEPDCRVGETAFRYWNEAIEE